MAFLRFACRDSIAMQEEPLERVALVCGATKKAEANRLGLIDFC
jgi:hypothetical protein